MLGAGFTATFGATGFVGVFETALEADLETVLAAGFTAGLAADFTAALATALTTGFGALLASALRAAGAAFVLGEDFDFAGIFEAALAIACTQPARGMGNCAPYTTLGRPAQVEEFRRMKA
ncbi:hypothetical protein QCM77_29385 [Bradyrhizobium sp. SSUT18]|uniref:hypothetical protein n=1 Tax=unclassified Bradyrhizobium TaxID=2631580 RepID=UPI00244B8422|nr:MULTISPECIES: hypothetical protein [unclassified Bradyrhizobium]MDH2355074.1 hypothetical protein [Bradyrhizobium sp. SSUT112]MDH2404036.1 hypothetical protein [Bradyrhizobium sp. SSUT18]